jgi:hypothetical protein
MSERWVGVRAWGGAGERWIHFLFIRIMDRKERRLFLSLSSCSLSPLSTSFFYFFPTVVFSLVRSFENAGK